MKKNPNVNQQLVGTENVGFIILDQKEDKLANTWVIGFNPKQKMFVTWFHNNEPGGYHFGYYIKDFKAAYVDFKQRGI